jgi:hypothetical protein
LVLLDDELVEAGTTTVSPAVSPETIWSASSPSKPTITVRVSVVPSLVRTLTECVEPDSVTAAELTYVAFWAVPVVTLTVTLWPGLAPVGSVLMLVLTP